MKQLTTLTLAAMIIIAATGCKKTVQPSASHNSSGINAVKRTVGPISFSGQTAWLAFGHRIEIEPELWQCQSSYDFCQYQYNDDLSGHVVTSGEATGEIGYIGSTLVIALDKSSMTPADVAGYLTRDGEFHIDADGFYATSGFDIKNVEDADQNTIGDIHVDAGVYPAYEDEHSILVVFDEP